MKKIRIQKIMDNSGVVFGTSGARGLVANMTDAVCYAYAAAFLQNVALDAETVVLGHDLRPSSPQIARACAQACTDLGRKIVYAGALPTPALAVYGAHLGAPALVVTGSHIPFDRNGIKFYRAEGEITKADEQAIRDAEVDVPDGLACRDLPEIEADVRAFYLRRYVDFFGAGSLAGMRVAVYEHSSVARDIMREIFEALGIEVISLGRADTFVPIDTEAVRPQDIEQARQWAHTHHFDAIISTDGDADRPLIGDEHGQWLRGDVVGILCAQFLAADIVATPVSSNTAVEKCGQFEKVARTRIGSPYVIAAMQAEAAPGKVVVGYEANGGFLLGSDVVYAGRSLAALPTRDAILPMLALLSMAKQKNCNLSALPSNLPQRFTASDRLQEFPTAQSRVIIEALQADSAAAAAMLAPESGVVAAIDLTDGLRVTFVNGDIVHLRPSGNAPELRCYAEAGSPEAAQALCKGCLQRLQESDF